MGKLTGLGRAFASSMLKGSRRAEALRKRKIEKELRAQGYSIKQAKMLVSQLQDRK
jgi:hypothetical protein